MKVIDENKIEQSYQELLLTKEKDFSKEKLEIILNKALEMKGLDDAEIFYLLGIPDEEKGALEELFHTAKKVKQEIYGNRMVLFAPLYISNLCKNECLYCAFRSQNSKLKRKKLSYDEIKKETGELIAGGHKRLLLVAGEAQSLDSVIGAIEAVYSVSDPKTKSNIRRVNVNIAPLSVEDFMRLEKAGIGTYQLFQETYHRETYSKLHLKGPKADYDYRLEVMDRAMSAGIHDVGVGVLFGLYDWRYEILALMAHIRHLEKKFGVGPHTISVPRIEPAHESGLSFNPPYAVSDEDFKKIVAVLRLAVPYTGIILSTREKAAIRKEVLHLGVSQMSAGSKTNPGGYGEKTQEYVPSDDEQFSLGDTRPMTAVIDDMLEENMVPSFCTGCYRQGRVGADFMDLAKPGLIKEHCLPNALYTFAEYLLDFADESLQKKGFAVIEKQVSEELPSENIKAEVKKNLQLIQEGKRDIYV